MYSVLVARLLLPSYAILVMISNNDHVITKSDYRLDARSILIGGFMWTVVMVCCYYYSNHKHMCLPSCRIHLYMINAECIRLKKLLLGLNFANILTEQEKSNSTVVLFK